jgi:hypothetical protein
MRNPSVLLLPAAAALAILSAAPSFAANNAPRDQEQQGVAVVHQVNQPSQATNACRPEYEVWSSHVKWVNTCSSGQTAYQIYDSHVTWQ